MLRFQPISIGFQNFLLALGRSGIFYSCLSGGQPGDGHAEGGAGHIVQADVVAEHHGGGITAVLAADAQLHVGVGGPAPAAGIGDQTAHAMLVQTGEGIALVDLLLIVGVQELAGVVPAEAEDQLGQVVGAEGEEVRVGGNVVGAHGGPGNLDHVAHLVLHIGAGRLDQLVGHAGNDALHIGELLQLAHQGDHDLGDHGPLGMAGLDGQGGLDDGAGLHPGDLGEGDAQAAAAVAHHGVELMETGDDGLDVLHALAHILGHEGDVLLLGGDELVERGVQETDGHGAALQGLVHGLEVALLHGLQLGQSLLALFHGVGADHLPDGGDAVLLKEHVLGAAQADALRAELHRLSGVPGVVGVGAHAHLAVLVRPGHDAAEFAGDGGVDGGDGLAVDVAGGAVQGDPVALLVDLAVQLELLVLLVHLDGAAARHTAGAHAPGHHGGVGGHAAPDGEDALGGHHALDVLGGGLQADQADLLAPGGPLLGVVSGEDDLAAGGAGGGGQCGGDGGGLLQRGGVKLGMEQGVQVAGVDHGHRLLFIDHALVHQIAGDFQGGGGGALAVAGLEHVELAVLHGELHVLHVAVVVLQLLAHVLELGKGFGELFRHLLDGHGGAHAGHHVLALGVGEELAHQLLLAGGGVAGEGHAGAAVVAHVAEGHGLHIDGGAPGAGNVVHAAVDDGPGVVPGAEDGLDGPHQLLLGVGGEVGANLGLVLRLELAGQRLQVVGVQLHVLGDPLLLLHLVDELLKILLAHLHDNVGVHLDEAAVAVPGPAGVVGLLGDDVHHLLVQAQVQDGVHHAGHGGPGAGADGDQQGVLQITELFPGDFLQLVDIFHDFGLDLVVDLLAVLIILGTGLGGDGEALGDGHADVGHLSQVGALAAQQVAHVGVALGKEVQEFGSHW